MPKNFLITGGCGFIGSNFINYLHKTNPEYFIVNYDKIDYCSNPDYIENRNNFDFARQPRCRETPVNLLLPFN